ncbi:MAG: hypothetical protein E6I75_03290 [Chloroflexi bacterium]|nr:MAG: hypothetical protein E6I75_03290 [Chloroflexota bacterium]
MQPANREPLSPERFLSEAAMLHQTWIRRFDAQHRRRPRPPEIEAERLRLVRRLQLVQRLQQESADGASLVNRLRELNATPREARLVEGDQPFLTALLQTWEAAQLPQASTIAAGANPPKPSGTVEFRW